MDYTISFENVTKKYKKNRDSILALNNLNLKIEPGIFGYLGRNGAGKTTSIKLLLGLIKPTSGKITVFGESPDSVSVKKRIGYLPEVSYLDKEFTPFELLYFLDGFFGINKNVLKKKIDMYLEKFDLMQYRNVKIKNFSKGMMQKISIIQAVLPDPDLLILDEPTSGLDPISQYEIRQFIKEFGRGNRTVFLSSHFLDEIDDVCDHVGIIHHGKLLRYGEKEKLLKFKNFYTFVIEGNIASFIKKYNGSLIDKNKGTIEIGIHESTAVMNELKKAKVKISEYYRKREGMHDFFIRVLEEDHE